jgi:hypothetical protein
MIYEVMSIPLRMHALFAHARQITGKGIPAANEAKEKRVSALAPVNA